MFQKGGPSPNPGGRPRAFRAYLDEIWGQDAKAAYDYLWKRFNDGRTSAKDKTQIAIFIIERRHGKAMQQNLNVNIDTEVKGMSNDELRAELFRIVGEELPGLIGGPTESDRTTDLGRVEAKGGSPGAVGEPLRLPKGSMEDRRTG